jgi:hypothetical protein
MNQPLKNFLLITIVAGATFNLSSCYPTGPVIDPYIVAEARQKENFYYIPSAPNTPLHSKKGDLNLTFMRTSSKLSGGEVQASFMPAKHIGIIGGYSFAGNSGNNDNAKYNRVELGAGFVIPLLKNYHFETYGGFGSGKILNTHATGTSKINLIDFFLQPSIALSDEKRNIQFAFVSKFSGVNFKVDTAFNTDREPFSTKQVKSLFDKPFHIVWEPGLVFRFGWKMLQFHAGYSFSTDLTNSDLYKPDGNFSAGFCLRFNTEDKK